MVKLKKFAVSSIMLGEVILFLLLIITAVINVISFVNPSGRYELYVGGRNDTPEMGKIDSITSKLMQVAELLTVRCSEKLRKEFVNKFVKGVEGSIKKPLPPVVTFDDIKHSLSYEQGTKIYRSSAHIGQRKLFLNELYFITTQIGSTVDRAVVLYAGAAPNNKGGFLSELCPNCKFILIDPNQFDIRYARPKILQQRKGPNIDYERAMKLLSEVRDDNDTKIFIINDLMTMEIARAVRAVFGEKNIWFISDIRTNYAANSDSTIEASPEVMPDALDILWNSAQQYNWIKEMRPRASMLKFRHPFYADVTKFHELASQSPRREDFELAARNGIDFIKGFDERRLVYFDGTVCIQPWQGQTSTETRLITTGDSIRDWGTPEEYENRLFYYNAIERIFAIHVNPAADKNIGFDHCNDCALEAHIWTEYCKEFENVADKHLAQRIKQLVERLSAVTGRGLIRDGHGHLFDRPNFDKIIPAIKKHNYDPDSRFKK